MNAKKKKYGWSIAPVDRLWLLPSRPDQVQQDLVAPHPRGKGKSDRKIIQAKFPINLIFDATACK